MIMPIFPKGQALHTSPAVCRQISQSKQPLPIVIAPAIAVRKHSNLSTNETANSYFEICLKRYEKRQERIPHRPMQKFNKFTNVFRIFFCFTNLFRKLKYIKYIKKYRIFYFCYYFSVVVKICEVFFDYLPVYVS